MNRCEQSAVITGGTGNLGRAVVDTFLDGGYSVFIPYHDEGKWGTFKETFDPEIADRIQGVPADLTEEADVRRMARKAEKEIGPPDVLLNLVGGFAFGDTIWGTDLSTWRKMMDMNLTTTFLCCKHMIPCMQERGGRIVNVSSKAALDLQPGSAAYAVSKAGIITLTRMLHEELKDTNITANAIMPSIIDTPVTRDIMPGGDPEKWVQPGEIADTLLAVCSGQCDALSGSVLRLFGEI